MTDAANPSTSAGEAETQTPTPEAASTTNGGTPAAPSPEPEAKLEATPAEATTEAKPEPTAEEAAVAAAQAARAVVPETAEAYQVNLDEAARTSLGLVDDDPMVKHLQTFAAEQKWSQGQIDDVFAAAASMAAAGLLDAALNPEAEAAALGENAAARRREVEVFAQALKSRNDGFDDAMFGELMSLTPTAAGIRMVEYMRKMMTETTNTPNAGGAAQSAEDDAKAEARKLASDPRYGRERAFTADADRKWRAAFPGSR